jgi:hypothetical protein
MKITPVTKAQAKSILKAVLYAFTAGFSGSFVLQATDVLQAVHDGKSALVHLGTSAIVGAVVGGINGVAFTVEKLLTEEK